MKKVVLIHYNEIALKGENRIFFERKLLENIKAVLQEQEYKSAQIVYGRLIIRLNEGVDEASIQSRISKVFGIANFSFAYSLSSDFDLLSKEIVGILKDIPFKTFRITAKRSDKKFPLSSQEINEQLGGVVLDNFDVKVDLEKPDLNCFLEISGDFVLFHTQKIKGFGGLPVGVSGKVLSLISSGFDSPIAAWQMMRRGATVLFVHFHSYPSTSIASQENVKAIIKVLSQYQGKAKLYLVPFLDIQKEITKKSDAQLRVVLYRRFMMRLAEMIAKKENCGALVTGDSLGQVASQTLENISVVSEAVSIPIFRPLIGTNKDDIINSARTIGTFNISSQPYEDCCSLFVPEHPATKASLDEVKRMEEGLDVAELMNDAVSRLEVV